jgi:hypothetical protein
MTGQVGSERSRSYSNEDIQLSSAAVLATDLYPASVEERAMIFLLFGAPRDKIAAKINNIGTCGREVVWITYPINIRIGM